VTFGPRPKTKGKEGGKMNARMEKKQRVTKEKKLLKQNGAGGESKRGKR